MDGVAFVFMGCHSCGGSRIQGRWDTGPLNVLGNELRKGVVN